jgi:hypothetical protein
MPRRTLRTRGEAGQQAVEPEFEASLIGQTEALGHVVGELLATVLSRASVCQNKISHSVRD